MGGQPDKNDFSVESKVEKTSGTGEDFIPDDEEEEEIEDTSGYTERASELGKEILSYFTGYESQGRYTIFGTFWATNAEEASGLRKHFVSGEPNRGGDEPLRKDYPQDDSQTIADGGEDNEDAGITRRGVLQGLIGGAGGLAGVNSALEEDEAGNGTPPTGNETETPTDTPTETPTETPEDTPTDTPTETPLPDYIVDLGKFIGAEGEGYEVDMRTDQFWGSLNGHENVELGVQDTGDLIAFNPENRTIYEFEAEDFPDSQYFDIPETGMDPHSFEFKYNRLDVQVEELPEGAAKQISEGEKWRQNREYKPVDMDEIVDHLAENTENGYEIMADYMFDFKATAEKEEPIYEDEWQELLEM